MGEGKQGGDATASAPLFETEGARGRVAFRFFSGSVLVAIILIWVYRALHVLSDGGVGERGRWVWVGLLAADLFYGFYWILTVSVRWNPIYRRTFKDRLSSRYEDRLPGVDVFVCTTDPKVEPPSLVASTVLSVMTYDYPMDNLSVYLSDDRGSELTFYALWEASRFATLWIPFCKKFMVVPRSPMAYFSGQMNDQNSPNNEWLAMRKLYREMENRIDSVVKAERIPEEIKKRHKEFSEWNQGTTSRDHQAIVRILIDGREHDAVDVTGSALPTLVYVAREKRPQHFHNFKAGAMNALIRVSSEISNGQIILNVDCDMYSNNPDTIRDALCFFMDEHEGDKIGYVQLPQTFNNTTKNDLYGNSLSILTVGLKYGCPLEDVITGISIQCKGWKSIFFEPSRFGFLGVAPVTLGKTLVQHKRWSEGHLQMLLSKYCPFIYGGGKIKLTLMMSYSIYPCWALSSLPTIFYIVAPSLCLLNGIPLFPSISSTWFLPFSYVILSTIISSIMEAIWSGLTIKGWWNEQRIWMFKRSTSYLFGFIDTVTMLMGFRNARFDITSKVTDVGVSERYEREMMEFGTSSSQMFIIISSFAIINLTCLLGGVLRIAIEGNDGEGGYLLQIVLCAMLVFLNFPVYNGMFFRKDEGRIPMSVTLKGVAFGLGVCLTSIAVGMMENV